MSDLDYDALRAAHRSSYPMGNRHHGTPERPDWGTFCVECKDSWPCDVARLLDLAQRAEADRAAVGRLGLGRLICDALDEHWPNSGVNGWFLADLIRAALDPKEDQPENGCGVCLTCDPPKGLMSRMHVCATCGNKRCPAASDCKEWECSGSNDPAQIPVRKADQ